MNFLKRVGWSLWRHKFKNMLVLLIFAAILAVTLTSFVIYSGTSYQVEVTQNAVANAVTLQPPTNFLNVGVNQAESFVNSKYVSRYNIVITSVQLESSDLLPVFDDPHDTELYEAYQEEMRRINEDPQLLTDVNSWAGEVQRQAIYYRAHPDIKNPGYRYEAWVWDEELQQYTFDFYDPNLSEEENRERVRLYALANTRTLDGEAIPRGYNMTAISDSEYYDSFSSGGYSLTQGRHFKAYEEDQDYVILSEAVAEANGLSVGDTIELQFEMGTQAMAVFSNPHPWKVKIIGLFEPPEYDLLGEIGYAAAARNFVFVPYQALFNYLWDLYDNDALLWSPSVHHVTAYMESPEDLDAFVDEVYQWFDVVEMTDGSSPPTNTNIEDLLSEGTFDSGDPEEIEKKFANFLLGSFDLHPWFYLMVDRGWYDMVAAPLESVNTLSLVMGVSLLVGAFVVLLLTCVFNVRSRKKEVGILLSMGESRGRVFLQIFLEQAVVLVLAAVIGFGAGAPLASSMGNALLEGRSDKVNAAYQQDKREYLEQQLGGVSMAVGMTVEDSQKMRSAATVAAPVQMQFHLDMRLTAAYFALAFGMLFLTVLVQMGFLLRLSPAKILTGRT